MSTVSISPISAASAASYRATLDDHEATGNTPGAALDALTAQLDPTTPMQVVVFIEPMPDHSFSPEQRRRWDELKTLYRLASTGRGRMASVERDEMERLFDAQFAASERRAEALAGERAR